MGCLFKYFSICGLVVYAALGCNSAFQSTASDSSSSDTVTIGGVVSGMTGGSITLLSHTNETVTLTADGSFTFSTQVSKNSTYSVTIQTQPAGHVCNTTNAVGTATSNVVVSVLCVIPSGAFTVGGVLTGLAGGQTLVIRNNNQNSTSLTADGAYTFSLGLNDTVAYNVTVETQPAGQICTIANGTGTIASANVTNANITCANIPGGNFTVGGTVSGLAGTGLVVRNNAADNTSLGADGTYVIANSYVDTTAYNVTVFTQPTSPSQTCTPSNNVGSIAGANVTNVDIACVTDQFPVTIDISGVANPETIVIQNFGVDVVNYTGSGTAPTSQNFNVTSMGSYLITVQTAPVGKNCVVTNNYGQVTNSAIPSGPSNPQVTCSTSTHTVAGTVTGLASAGLVLQNNGGDDLSVNTTSFTFATTVNYGAAYSVTVLNDPSNPKQTCVPSSASGVINGNVTDVLITCTTDTQGMSVNVNGLGTGESIQVSNGTDVLTVTGDALVGTADSSAFPTALTQNTNYTITTSNPSPGGLVCVTANPVGTVQNSAIVITINCGTTTYSISGTISQVDGNTNGNTTYVKLYGSDTETLTPIATHAPLNTTGLDLSGINPAFSFTNIPPGTYYVRAYRDIGNPRNASMPDGLPSLKQDYQSQPILATVVAANVSGLAVTLQDTPTIVNNDHYDQFNVSTANHDETAYIPNNGSGSGLCGGYFMHIDANIPSGTNANVTPPTVSLPDGSIITMLDDGGCDNAIANNSNKSYDFLQNDFQYSYGIRNPTAANAGDYRLHYRFTGGGNNYLHEEVDNIATVVRLARNSQITAPDFSSILITTTPTFNWAPTPGAVAYDLQIQQEVNPGPGYNHGSGTLAVTTYTIPGASALTADPDAYAVTIQAFDANSGAGGDVDAESRGPRQHFVLDTATTNSITVSGSITNNSGDTTSNILITATGNENTGANANREEAFIVLPGTATNYTMQVLSDGSNDGQVNAVIDTNNSLDEDSYHDGVQKRYSDLNASGNITQNIVFTVPVVQLSPANGATNLGNTPTFSWQAYATSVANAGGTMPPGAYSYIFFYGQNNPNGGGNPVGVFGLSNATTSLNFASITSTQRYDIWCAAQPPGSWNGSTCVNGTGSPNDLSQMTNWFWGVAVVECDFNDYLSSADLNFNFVNDYLECIIPLLGNNFNPYAESGNRAFNTN